METVIPETFSTNAAAALAGVSYRQIDYWCRTGAIPTQSRGPGSGNHRRWTADEIWIARVLGVLSNLGATGDVWRAVATWLGSIPPDLLPPMVWITADGRIAMTPRSGWCLDLRGIRQDLDVEISYRLAE